MLIDAPRVLDFDCEARPLSWIGGDYVSKEVTAIACSFIGDARVYCWLLGDPSHRVPPDLQLATILEAFTQFYNQADVLTGHYIRAYDLPLLNGAMAEAGLPPLGPKLTIDTKSDLARLHGVSKSQESLAAMLGVQAPKVHMTQGDWRAANRLTIDGLAKTRERVVGDVRQHKQLYAELSARGMLRPPKRWAPR